MLHKPKSAHSDIHTRVFHFCSLPSLSPFQSPSLQNLGIDVHRNTSQPREPRKDSIQLLVNLTLPLSNPQQLFLQALLSPFDSVFGTLSPRAPRWHCCDKACLSLKFRHSSNIQQARVDAQLTVSHT